MFLVGLTGGIATGKSSVSSMLTEMDVKVIDADLVARQVVMPQRKAWRRIRKCFGDDVLQENGEIDRSKLATIVFSDEEKRKLLNQITHPEIYKAIFWDCIWHLIVGTQFVVIDLPLLFESGYMVKFMSRIIVVSCDQDIQIQRLMKRNDYTLEESMSRINAQMSLKSKCELADYVVDNNGSIAETRDQVELIVKQLRSSNAHWKVRIIVWGSFVVICSGLIYLTCKSIDVVNSYL